MEKKYSGILLFMLLIFSTVLPVVGITNNKITTNNIIEKENFELCTNYKSIQENDSDWNFWSNQPDMYTIPSGNIGIGTENPSAKLDVEVSSGGAATIGASTNVATGNYAVAIGSGTTASKNYSIAMGHYSTASGLTSTAMGWGTTASGSVSTAMGEDTTASGSFSTAMGRSITVNGDYSVGIGLSSTPYTVDSSNVISIMGGCVGIGITSPSYPLDVYDENDIVAQFSGRVIGVDAVNDNEFVTKSQVDSVVVSEKYTPTGSDDPYGIVGDISWDEHYFYVKTCDGWKRAALETWSSTSK